MIVVQENKRKSEKNMKLVVSKSEKSNLPIKLIINDEKHFADRNNKEINKETIRRLRIQNKKLIEQIIKLKEEIKKSKINRAHVLNHINELLKLVNR